MNEKLKAAEAKRLEALEWIRLGEAEGLLNAAMLAETEAARYRLNNQGHSEGVCLEIAGALRARVAAMGVSVRECRANDIEQPGKVE